MVHLPFSWSNAWMIFSRYSPYGFLPTGFVHGGGLRGNPNCHARNRKERDDIYRNPWQVGNYATEWQGARDAHFWYRMAKHFRDPEFLWAAEQLCLGGRPPRSTSSGHADGKVPPEYVDAYNKRFAWFNEQGIKPKCPAGRSAIGYLSPLKYKVPERLYLCPGRQAGKPFVSFFL